jgi:hypothetical protein
MIFGSYQEWIFEKCLKGGVGLIILIVLFFSGGDIFNVIRRRMRGEPLAKFLPKAKLGD